MIAGVYVFYLNSLARYYSTADWWMVLIRVSFDRTMQVQSIFSWKILHVDPIQWLVGEFVLLHRHR